LVRGRQSDSSRSSRLTLMVNLKIPAVLHSDLVFAMIHDDGRQIGGTTMHIPLVIAILAFLAFALLPVLDRSAGSEINTKDLRSYFIRIARWTKK
jgi:hypothetical protein